MPLASLLLPLAGSYARVVSVDAVDRPSGNAVYLPGQTADKGVMDRRGSRDGGSNGSNGSTGSKGSKGTESPH